MIGVLCRRLTYNRHTVSLQICKIGSHAVKIEQAVCDNSDLKLALCNQLPYQMQ